MEIPSQACVKALAPVYDELSPNGRLAFSYSGRTTLKFPFSASFLGTIPKGHLDAR